MHALRILVAAVQGPSGRDHTPERLRTEQPAVRVPEVPRLGEVLDPVALVGVGVGTPVEQLWREPSRARGGGEREVERRSARRLEHLLGPCPRLELEAAPIGIGGPGERGVAAQPADGVGKSAQPGDLEVKGEGSALLVVDAVRAGARRSVVGEHVGDPFAEIVEGEQRVGAFAEQQREADPLDPGLVQKLLRIEALHQRMRGEEAHQRARRGAADRVDARLLVPLGIEMAHRQREPRGRAGLISAQRSAS